MSKNNDLETARNILNNAAQMNMSKEIILKISQKLDEYINVYYRNGEKDEEKQDRISETARQYFTSRMHFYCAFCFSGRQKGRSKLMPSTQWRCRASDIHPQKSGQPAKYMQLTR